MDLFSATFVLALRRVAVTAFAGVLGYQTALAQGNIVRSWPGLYKPNGLQGGPFPSDSHGAVGPAGIIGTVNTRIAYFSKSGGTLWDPVDFQSFWSSKGNSGGNFDAKTIFDLDSRRFFVLTPELDSQSRFWINIAVSRSADPQTSGSTDWIFYRFNATATSNGDGWGDYTCIAADAEAVYATYNMIAFDESWSHPALFIFNKHALMDGTGSMASMDLPDSAPLQPVTPFGGNPGNVVYLVADWGTDAIKIYAVSDPQGSRSLSTQVLNVTDRGTLWASDYAPQPYGGGLRTLAGWAMGNASWVGGDVWFCTARGPVGGPSEAVYYRLRLNGWPTVGNVSMIEDATVGEANYWNLQPAIGVNTAGDVCMTWTRVSSTSYPAMMCSTRFAGTQAFGAPQVVWNSATNNQYGLWGDYATVWPDPNGGWFWIVNQWSRGDGTWGTWWAEISSGDFYVYKNAPNTALQNGSLDSPYTTVGAAHAAITHGRIQIFGGNYDETLQLNKPVRLTSYDGLDVVIGRP